MSLLPAAGLTTMLVVVAVAEVAAGERQRDRLGRVVGQVGEGGHAAHDGGHERPHERPGAAAEIDRHHRAVVARLEVAELVLLVDNHRLSGRGEWLAGRRL